MPLFKGDPNEIILDWETYNLTGNTDNLELTNSVLAFTSDGAYNLTGMINFKEGEEMAVRICNDGEFAITLKHNDSGSDAENRFYRSTGTDYVLQPKVSIPIFYRVVAGRTGWWVN